MISIVLQILGLILLFTGNLLISDAVTRFDTRKSKWWKWGNRLQGAGFILALLSIYIQYAEK
ncbi:hypothetical protein COT77_02655 [Candidatus Berkelbacteria bacterium CG10_big_fil_rev_8_21_14_0_10_41_12]|uniref:Lysine transporter LysE n=1 Tax=Candidatus Berkelbacteria bacterium CG10_big_fil_rev_8_21_14_0_10_41_12 TaxID=1974513 RepID=A0A2M6WWR5_9BACT|nr:MAG: hypothetical protein COT77_02655 [Candidatus Berkelbacteria bacterium CG10_big_fil_rev_8_21_14_0_10_41_12]